MPALMPTGLNTEVLPDDILAALFVIAKKKSSKERFAFRGHDYQLQEIFLELSKKYSLLETFVFSDSGPIPYSPILNESVSRLQLSGLVGRENPNYEVVFLTPAAEKYYAEVLEQQFSAEDITQLEQIAQDFLGRVTDV